MTEKEIDAEIKVTVIGVLKIPDGEYNEDLAAGDHPSWDSIGHVNLLMAVEKRFDIVFDVTDAIDIETLVDMKEMTKKYVALKSGSV